ncbi:MAG: helicase C-terminal domain-containing protein [Clostridia bacterium]|nr:helicase C-terminal domain-containing protein [Clostridia bacterium]
MSMPVVRMSVRAVVETTLHESDLSPAASAARRMREGSLAHRARQSTGREADGTYCAEVALSTDYEGEALLLHVVGRADAVFTRADGVRVIEEIKLGVQDAPLIPAHRAQAAMYGHMLCAREELGGACLRVLYVDTEGRALAQYEEERTAAELLAEFCALCEPAARWEERKLARRQARDESLTSLPFPFDGYRAGQRRFAGNVYIALRERRRLFAQAPTGIGKTVAALYPALRAVGEGRCARVLFLTARTTGRRSAMEAMALLGGAGARAMTVEITAKDKACACETRDCRPETCPFARGFYDRLPAALEQALAMERLGRGEIAALAAEHGLCPFELSLQLAVLADVVVCDYNYVYDPFVAMDALLGTAGGACLLVDEAHQLAPRVRDAHSAVLGMDMLRELRRRTGKAHGRTSPLYRALTGVMDALRGAAKDPAFDEGGLSGPPEALGDAVSTALEAASQQLAQGGGPCAADAFSMAMSYCFAAGRFCERYALLTSGGEKHASIELYLLNAAPEILALSKRARGTVYFSATLAPFDAARRMLGSEEGDACLALPSPFDPAQLTARIEPIDIRYASREQTAPQVADAIAAHLRAHPGHTLIFFPSYAYMARIGELLSGQEGMMDTAFLCEARGMSEDEKNALLGAFDVQDGPRAALLAVLGGGFGEGIDLPGEKLSNVIIVSTGLPQPDARVRAMQAYYEREGGDGFFLCMTLPGMVRVIQAAGRLIRTDEDRGSLLLIDSRYRHARTRALLAGTLAGGALGIR